VSGSSPNWDMCARTRHIKAAMGIAKFATDDRDQEPLDCAMHISQDTHSGMGKRSKATNGRLIASGIDSREGGVLSFFVPRILHWASSKVSDLVEDCQGKRS
jgi:hypothetical protein